MELELEGFLRKHRLTVSLLTNAGMLKKKEILSTADIFKYQLTDAGKPFLHEIRGFQLIFIKKGKVQPLLNTIGNAKR